MKDLITISIPPLGVILSAALIAGVGLLFLCFAKLRARKKPGFPAEILRDTGIAFIVAAVVTVVYEANTRSVKEHSDMVSVLNTIMGSGITKDVWGEVESKVLARNRLRRGATVELKLLREVTLPDGRKIAMPKHQLVMFMKYEYDLYALTSGQAKAKIWQALDWQMYDKATDLPMFLSIEVKRGNQVIQRLDAATIKSTKGVFDRDKGTMSLDGDLGVDLPPPDDKNPLHITTERYEVVNFPGAYTLYMPDTVAPPLPGKDPTTREPTIKVTFEYIPDDIQVKLETYLEEHVFNPSDKNARVWEFNDIMLLGQAVSFTFKKRAST